MVIKSDKVIKKEFKQEASKNPEKYYATEVLQAEGYMRKHCACGTYFWTVNEDQTVCGDAECSGGFRLLESNPCKRQLSYIDVWKEFSELMKNKGYEPIKRYPVVARWNPTMEFTIASIAAFQPYVVNGAIAPPAEKLVIPQFCLRFGDVDNVGITMSHNTGFIMIGQHMFVTPDNWDQDTAFRDIMDWLLTGLGLPKEEITFHEDAWAGGGNFGPCMEFFSRGVELGNQVYMMFEQTPEGPRELQLKVLDMGMGHERNAWFSQGKGTVYDATFPTVIKRLREKTGVQYDEAFMHKYIPVGAYLNLDEVEDMQAAWKRVAEEMGMDAVVVQEKLEPNTALYSIGEHSRSLLFALADGGLPSNTGGGYNLRVIFRRAQEFIDSHQWQIDIADVCEWHAEYLQELFPELLQNINDVRKILAVEKRKYKENKKKARSILEKEFSGEGSITVERMLELYDSNGISPEQIKQTAKSMGRKIEVPDNFYQLVAERHEQQEQTTATRQQTFYPVEDMPPTKILYYGPHDAVVFQGTILKVIKEEKEKDKKNDAEYSEEQDRGRDMIILDQTAFYPTSGGQEHDTGLINGEKVVKVIKQNSIVIHIMEQETQLSEGDKIQGIIDLERRNQLAQHHTTTHIINGAARKVLGDHVWQAGAAKTEEKGRIDITHYDTISDEELKQIEEEANKIVGESIPIAKTLLPKNEAEKEHGFRLYQGGAIPGAEIRVVDIPGFDTEACGGTHLDNTSQAGKIKILKSTKVQDGIIRIEFVAGKAAECIIQAETAVIEKIQAELNCEEEQIPGRCEELFQKWKKARKGKLVKEDIALQSTEPFPGDIMTEAARVLKTQPEHVLKTIERFKKDIQEKAK